MLKPLIVTATIPVVNRAAIWLFPLDKSHTLLPEMTLALTTPMVCVANALAVDQNFQIGVLEKCGIANFFDCRDVQLLAQFLKKLVHNDTVPGVVAPVDLNSACFCYVNGITDEAAPQELNAEILLRAPKGGSAVLNGPRIFLPLTSLRSANPRHPDDGCTTFHLALQFGNNSPVRNEKFRLLVALRGSPK